MYIEKHPIARAGWSYILVLGVVTLLLFSLFKPAALVTAVLLLFTAYFFRNPRRAVPRDKRFIISPADGVVMQVEEKEEEHFIKGQTIRVSIFLSIFNVHLNRAPVEGMVEYVKYRPGKFLPAFKSHAAEINEKNYLGINTGVYKIMVTQITGFIARRIVCYAKKDDILNQGQIFGLIKFGSCTEIFVPKNIEILVKPGDKVKGGETVIGRLPDES